MTATEKTPATEKNPASKENLAEWLETDGLGGFASGTVCGQRTRRYHALLLVAQNPPADRVVLVNGLDAWVETAAGTFPISTQFYRNDVESPSGYELLQSFSADPWPTWRFRISDDVEIVQELLVPRGMQGTMIRWKIEGNPQGVNLHVRPFLSGRDFHGMHHANDSLNSATTKADFGFTWQTYGDLPQVCVETNAKVESKPDWYYSFLYQAEQDRGLDTMEDLFSPAELTFAFTENQTSGCLLLGAGKPLSEQAGLVTADPITASEKLETSERERRKTIGHEKRMLDAYLVNRGDGKTIIAGYPWFGDWGRDTFISLRGLCLAVPDRLDVARSILQGWATTVSQGMLPNRFPDTGDTPEYNSVDASLWYIAAVADYLAAAKKNSHFTVSDDELAMLHTAVESILNGYSQGTRYGIRLDDDGLVAAGEPGVQLTWMDAKVGDWVVTPRIGKPVEIQCLWLNALHYASTFSDQWSAHYDRGLASFRERFWNNEAGYLYDVIDADHEPGKRDDAFRPNQIFAVGGLSVCLLDDDQARRVVDQVEEKLLTPIGLRSLAPGHPDYKPHYEGGVLQRDGSYHQGTVWPWLIGPFVEAWVRVRNNSEEAKQEARDRFLKPLETHMQQAGLGHVSEICDAEPPYTPRGCPFQAWSLAEYLRLKHQVLG